MSVEDTNIPPVPSQSPIDDTDPQPRRFGPTWSHWFEQVRSKVNILNQSIVNLAGVTGAGFLVHKASGWVTRTLKGTAGNISVTNGDGDAGDPTIDLVDTAVTPGSYTNVNVTVDQKGRLTAVSNGSASGSPLTTKGDLFGFGTGNARVPVGADGTFLAADSTSPLGISYKTSSSLGVLQTVVVMSANSYYTTNTTITVDNTIPQITEGDDIPAYAVSITPISATSNLLITLNIPWLISPSSVLGARLAIFRDSVANAIFANAPIGAGIPVTVCVSVPSVSTTPTTFHVRWGTASGTSYINRNSTSSNFFGGALITTITVQEYI